MMILHTETQCSERNRNHFTVCYRNSSYGVAQHRCPKTLHKTTQKLPNIKHDDTRNKTRYFGPEVPKQTS